LSAPVSGRAPASAEQETAPRLASETRLRILTATRELYAGKGSRGTTTREVADRAGVNEATVFRHFGTKGQLLSAMLDHFGNSPEFPATIERLRGYGSIEEQLYELARAAIDAMTRKQDLIRVSMAEELTDPVGHLCVWRAPTEARRQLRKFFGEKVADGELHGSPDWLARSFMSLFFALVMGRQIWADMDVSTETSVTHLVDIFLNGARAR
jgi:AcrR family transcriptional regulator